MSLDFHLMLNMCTGGSTLYDCVGFCEDYLLKITFLHKNKLNNASYKKNNHPQRDANYLTGTLHAVWR